MNFLAKNIKDFRVCAEFLTLNFSRFSNWEFLASSWEKKTPWYLLALGIGPQIKQKRNTDYNSIIKYLF